MRHTWMGAAAAGGAGAARGGGPHRQPDDGGDAPRDCRGAHGDGAAGVARLMRHASSCGVRLMRLMRLMRLHAACVSCVSCVSCGFMRLHAACVSCVSCGSRWQAKQFEAELAELRAARDEEAGSLTAQLEGCRRTERDLIEEISKTNLELTLVHSEKEQAVARGEAAERERDRTRERMTESNKAAV
jgi:hypothetical protein